MAPAIPLAIPPGPVMRPIARTNPPRRTSYLYIVRAEEVLAGFQSADDHKLNMAIIINGVQQLVFIE